MIFEKDSASRAPKMFVGLTDKAGFSLKQKAPLSRSVKSQIRKLHDILGNTVGNPLRHYTLVTIPKDKQAAKVIKQVSGVRSKHIKAAPIATVPNLPVKISVVGETLKLNYHTTGTTQTIVPLELKRVIKKTDFDREEIESTDEFADAYIGAVLAKAEAAGVKTDSPNVMFRMTSKAGDIDTGKYAITDHPDLLLDNARMLFDRYFGDDPLGMLDEHAAHRLSGISIWDNSALMDDPTDRRFAAARQYMDIAGHTFTEPKKQNRIKVKKRRTGRNDGRRFEVKKRKR